MRIPFHLYDVPACFTSAASLLGAAEDDAKAITDPLDDAENLNLMAQFGDGAEGAMRGKIKRLADSAGKDLTKKQRLRRTRTVRDQVDRALVDLMGLYRDVLAIQFDSDVELINDEMRPQLAQLAARSTTNDTGRRLRALAYTRQQIGANVAPQLALESLMVELKDPWIRTAAI